MTDDMTLEQAEDWAMDAVSDANEFDRRYTIMLRFNLTPAEECAAFDAALDRL